MLNFTSYDRIEENGEPFMRNINYRKADVDGFKVSEAAPDLSGFALLP
jgi:hypothetical protein